MIIVISQFCGWGLGIGIDFKGDLKLRGQINILSEKVLQNLNHLLPLIKNMSEILMIKIV